MLARSLIHVFIFSLIHVPSRSISFQVDPNSNEYLLGEVGFDTAENEPLKVHSIVRGLNFHRAAPPPNRFIA
jgi:hypothetical protein